MENTKNLKLKGTITWVLRDSKTLESQERGSVTNLITENAIRKIASNAQIGSNIFISSQITVPDKHMSDISDVIAIGETEPGITTPRFFDKTDSTNMYGQWQKRFYPTGTEITIHTIGLTTSTNTTDVVADAYTRLDTPCVQGETQILDIYYRVEFIENNTFGVTDHAIRNIAINSVINDNELDPAGASAAYIHGSASTGSYYTMGYDSTIDEQDNYHLRWNSPSEPNYTIRFGDNVIAKSEYRQDLVWDMPKSFNNDGWPIIGRIYGAMNFQNIKNESISRASVLLPSQSKIQPMFFHNTESLTPFENVNTLATGDGIITPGGVWTNDWPTHYRVDIVKSGDTGVSRYSFAKRKFSGWVDSTYENRCVTDPFGSSSQILGADRNIHKCYPISDNSVVWWESIENGAANVTVVNHLTGEHQVFNSDSSPALPALNPQQCCAGSELEDSDIWIASPTEGLYKIARPSNVITKAAFSEPHINEDKCYAVSLGKNGRIWAVMDGALVYSDNEGGLFTDITQNTTPSFSHIGITDFNWKNVRYMHADRDTSPENDHQLMFVTFNDIDTSELVSWRLNGGLGETTLVKDLEAALNPSNIQLNKHAYISPNALTCAHAKGLWSLNTISNIYSYQNSMFLKFDGTIIVESSYSSSNRAAGFQYDSYGNPYLIFIQLTDSPLENGRIRTFNANGEQIGRQYERSLVSTRAEKSNPFILGGKLLFLNNTLVALGENDPTGGTIEDITYDKYGYNANTSSWELNYYGDPVSNTRGTLELRRNSFGPSSWDFDGANTYIDVEQQEIFNHRPIQAIAMTVASSQIPDGKLKTLFSLVAPKFNLNWIDNVDPSKMSFSYGGKPWDENVSHEIGLRPIDSNDHRLFLLLGPLGNELSIYLDGVLLVDKFDLGEVYDFGAYSRFLLGANQNRSPGSYFQGTIKNLIIYDNSMLITDGLIVFDNDNHVTFPSRNISDFGSETTYSYLDSSGMGHFDLGPYMTYNTANKQISGATNSSYNKHLISEQAVLDEEGEERTRVDFKFIEVPDAAVVGFNPSAATRGLTTTISDQVDACIYSTGSGNSYVFINGVSVATLGSWTTDTIFSIELDGNTFNAYVDNLLVHTEPNFKTSTHDHHLWIKTQYSNSFIVELVNFTSNYLFDDSAVIAHWEMEDDIVNVDSKLTHDTEEVFSDGITMKFEDKVDADINWYNSDHYTFAACDGFLKDNIRTFKGGYSLYYKPAISNETDTAPVAVAASSTEPGSLSGNSYGAYSVAIGNQGSGTGAFHSEFLYLETHNRERMLQVFLNGTEVTEYIEDASSTGVDNEIQSGGAIEYSDRNGEDHIQNNSSTGDTIWFKLEDGTIHETTIAGYGENTVIINDPILAGNPFRPDGVVWVHNQLLIQGEVACNRYLGIFRFHSSDVGKTVTSRYTYLYDV